MLLVCTSLGAQKRECLLSRQKTAGEIVLAAQGGDPMLSIVEQVRAQYGWLVSYEQPVFQPEHMIDVSVPEWRRIHPNDEAGLVPREQALAVRFDVPTPGPKDAERTLLAIVNQANSTHTFVHYGLVHGKGDRYSIFGEDAYRGSNGIAGTTIRISDTPGARPVSEVNGILLACSQQSPVPFELGTFDPNTANRVQGPAKHTTETCRNALERIAQAVSPTAVYEVREDTVNKAMAVSIMPLQYRDPSGDCPSGATPATRLQ